MIKVGTYNQMKVLRAVEFGVYLDDDNDYQPNIYHHGM